MSSESPLVRRFGQVLWSVRQRGIGKTLRTIGQRILRARRDQELLTHPFDLEHGTDTSGLIGGRDLRTGHPHDIHSTAYFGTPPSRLRRALQHWLEADGVSAASETTFIDIGCGKGRALLVASEFRFHEVVGVEINSALADITRRNIDLWRSTRSNVSAIKVFEDDATTLPWPAGAVLVYLYNPFGAPVLRALLEKLVEARVGIVAPLHVLYMYPEQAAVFGEFPQFELLWTAAIPLEPDEPPDGVSSPEDPCSLYRLRLVASE